MCLLPNSKITNMEYLYKTTQIPSKDKKLERNPTNHIINTILGEHNDYS